MAEAGAVQPQVARNARRQKTKILVRLLELRLDILTTPSSPKWARTSPARIATFDDKTRPRRSVDGTVAFRKRAGLAAGKSRCPL
jgi:hypothetical protein